MESSLTFLERVANILIFCMALTILFLTNKELGNIMTSLKSSISDQQVLYEQSLEVINEDETTYGEVIGILMSELTCDITINNLELESASYNPQSFNFKQIDRCSYSKSYTLDTKGNIVKIMFMRLGSKSN